MTFGLAQVAKLAVGIIHENQRIDFCGGFLRARAAASFIHFKESSALQCGNASIPRFIASDFIIGEGVMKLNTAPFLHFC